MASTATMESILGAYPEYELVSEEMKQVALSSSVIPDSAGLLPHEGGYQPTYDSFYACLVLIPFMKAQPAITTSASEGTSVTVTPTDWGALETYLKSQSVIAKLSAGAMLRAVSIPYTPHVKRTRMEGGGSYGDIDTDIS